MKPVNKEILKEEIQWLIEAINEQVEAITSYDGRIPQIEFDIILENVRKFYENLHLLQHAEDPYAYFEEKVREVPVVKSMVVKEPAKEPEPVPEPEPEPVAVEEPVVVFHHPPSPEKEETAAAEQPAEMKPAPSLHVKTPSDIDLFSDAGSGFTEKLKEAREKSLGPRMRPQKPGDLKSAISINEKFLIINELFSGNLREYNEMVETLNGYHDTGTALEYLDLLRKKNMWDSGTTVFSRLKELVEKRFA
jgi:hypothetical protein